MPGRYTPLALVFGDILTEGRAASLETQYLLAAGRELALGGLADVGEASNSYVDVPGAIVVLLGHDTDAAIHAMGFVSGGTGSLRLYDLTAGAEVAGSEQSFSDTAPTLQVGDSLTLLSGHAYKLQVRISVGTEHVVVYGAKLVTE